MIEVERKYEYPARKLPALRRRLRQLGARLDEQKTQVDIYYSPPHETFLGQPKFLRLRETREDGRLKASFEYHVPFGRYAAREHEVKIDDPRILKHILRRLGFKQEIQVIKKREEWQRGQIEIEIDQVKNLGTFVELEVMGQTQAAALKLIDKLAVQLELKPTQQVMGYFKLLMRKYRPAMWRKYYGQTKN
jgi:adenylate cyclase class 2